MISQYLPEFQNLEENTCVVDLVGKFWVQNPESCGHDGRPGFTRPRSGGMEVGCAESVRKEG
jgi:hypothetical protein